MILPRSPSPLFSFSDVARMFATVFVRSPQSASSFASSRPSVPSPFSRRSATVAAWANVSLMLATAFVMSP